jgi:hypothetical protein
MMERRSEVLNSQARKKALREALKACRKNLLTIIASNLGETLPDKLTIASKLLLLYILPDSVSLVLFAKAFWIGSSFELKGTLLAFGPYLDGSILLRYSFQNWWYLQTFFTDHVNRSGYFEATIKCSPWSCFSDLEDSKCL